MQQIPIGGQGVIGSAGYIRAIPEIMEQMRQQNIHAKYLIAGYGSTGTFGGLWAGAKYYNAPFQVIGIPVQPNYRSKEVTAGFINELSDFYEMGFRCQPDDLWLETGGEDPYYAEGYDVPDPVAQQYIALLARQEGIFVGPCYTAKVFRGFVDLVRSGRIPAGEDAIFLHTGGAPELWGKEHLDHMQQQFWSGDDQITVMRYPGK